ncbi:hypothetical protein LJR189_004759 [Acidovorax delafieldii]|uniref:hypothetical protein n=1 Tax=Acidovorax delafieldii TaxID=47920 RepID=UPI003ECD8312
MTSRQGPPPIEAIIADAVGKTDTGYALGVHMHGLRGAWHRLWGMLILQATLGDAEDGIRAVRDQVGQALGRPITDVELARLNEHATVYAAKMPRIADNTK